MLMVKIEKIVGFTQMDVLDMIPIVTYYMHTLIYVYTMKATYIVTH